VLTVLNDFKKKNQTDKQNPPNHHKLTTDLCAKPHTTDKHKGSQSTLLHTGSEDGQRNLNFRRKFNALQI